MGQRCVHYTERVNGTRVLYAPNQCYKILSKSQRPVVFPVTALVCVVNVKILGVDQQNDGSVKVFTNCYNFQRL